MPASYLFLCLYAMYFLPVPGVGGGGGMGVGVGVWLIQHEDVILHENPL